MRKLFAQQRVFHLQLRSNTALERVWRPVHPSYFARLPDTMRLSQ
jgi:hypothetical protein